jgi:hypothetical protein
MRHEFPRGCVTPSPYLKKMGLKSLQNLHEETGVSISTLREWYLYRHALFDVMIDGMRYRQLKKEQAIEKKPV